MSEIQTAYWSETAANNNATPPDGWPEGQAPNTVNDCARELMAAVKRDWNRSRPTITSAGTTSALTLTYANAPTLAEGLQLTFRLGANVAAGATLAVNGGTAYPIYARAAAIGENEYFADDIMTVYWRATASRWDTAAGAGAATINQGTHTLTYAGAALTPRTTNGPAQSSSETTTNKIMVDGLSFSGSTAQYAQLRIRMPPSWDNTSTLKFLVGCSSADTGDVVWKLQAVAIGHGDALDAAFGTAVAVTRTMQGAGKRTETALSGAVTIAGTPADGDMVVIQLYRDPADAGDTVASAVTLLDLTLFVTINAPTDA